MADVKPPSKSGRYIFYAIFLLIVIPIGCAVAWTWVSLNISYSNGERVGYIQKISNKGWACKTWEGELSMVNVPGAAPQTFAFSVRDEKVARNILDAAGKRVAISYDQHRGVPSSCFGETEYFVTAVRALGQ